MNTINLNQEEQKELKGLYAKLSNLYKERAKLEVLKKDREENLKEEMQVLAILSTNKEKRKSQNAFGKCHFR